MKIRTYYWKPSIDQPKRKSALSFFKKKNKFLIGNAGDIFNEDLIKWAYPGTDLINQDSYGPRALFVGSTAHKALQGDLISGIGCKYSNLPKKNYDVYIRGVRGPLTLNAFEDAGHDISSVNFLGDPGLLIGEIYPDLFNIQERAGKILFIPHYRMRFTYHSNKRYEVKDIDDSPYNISKSIRSAEYIITSSLHGLIWAHALGRPVSLVKPDSTEPLFKFHDYLLSVEKNLKFHDSPEDALKLKLSASPTSVEKVIKNIKIPDIDELKAREIIT